jgi:hypothetical protein
MLFRTTLIATLLTATVLAAPVTFKDFGVIWIDNALKNPDNFLAEVISTSKSA